MLSKITMDSLLLAVLSVLAVLGAGALVVKFVLLLPCVAVFLVLVAVGALGTGTVRAA